MVRSGSMGLQLSENLKLTIKGANKSGKIVIRDTGNYDKKCELRLSDDESCEILEASPKLNYVYFYGLQKIHKIF